MSFLRRQIVTAALTANALRPPTNQRAGAFAFFPGWLVGELAPQIGALTAVDAITHVASKKRGTKLGLALAVANIAGHAVLVNRSGLARGQAEQVLQDGIGADYSTFLATQPTEADLATPWRRLLYPFRFTDPGVQVERNIAYGDAPKRRNMLDIYRPSDTTDLKNAPVLLQVHGGGWVIGEKEQQGRALMNRMAAQGWVCVAINYRLSPKNAWPAHIVDVKKAIAWVKENIASYGGDPDHVVITGGSAGGHLASLAATTANDPAFQPGFEEADTSLAACVPFYGVYDLAASTGLKTAEGMRDEFLAPRVFQKKWKDAPELFEQASPILRITEDTLDMFVVHGASDTLVDVNQARTFVARLKEISKHGVTYLEIPGTQHAFEVFPSIRSEHVIRAVERWLNWQYRTTHQQVSA